DCVPSECVISYSVFVPSPISPAYPPTFSSNNNFTFAGVIVVVSSSPANASASVAILDTPALVSVAVTSCSVFGVSTLSSTTPPCASAVVANLTSPNTVVVAWSLLVSKKIQSLGSVGEGSAVFAINTSPAFNETPCTVPCTDTYQ